jgi:polar amino acid transport system substrate-binding protein
MRRSPFRHRQGEQPPHTARPRGHRVRPAPGKLALAVLGAGSAVALLTPAVVASASARANPKLSSPAIIQSGELQFCSTIATPPVEYYTSNHTPTGTDVQLGSAIAHQLGLKPVWLDVTFSGIIPALQAGHCDLIMSDLYIKPTRLKVVNFIPYMYASESVVVKKGNPSHITGMTKSLCGHAVAANFSTTAVEDAQAQSAACVKAGKKKITITQFKTPIEALQQLALGRATAFATTTEDGAYYMAQRKGLYQFAGNAYGKILAGIAVNKGDSKLESAVTGALKTVFTNHTYDRIFKRFGLAQEELAKPMKDQS